MTYTSTDEAGLIDSIELYLDAVEKTPAFNSKAVREIASNLRMILEKEKRRRNPPEKPLLPGSRVRILRGPYTGRYAVYKGAGEPILPNEGIVVLTLEDPVMDIDIAYEDFKTV